MNLPARGNRSHVDLFSGIGGFALAALGNAIVPQVAEEIIRAILEAEET